MNRFALRNVRALLTLVALGASLGSPLRAQGRAVHRAGVSASPNRVDARATLTDVRILRTDSTLLAPRAVASSLMTQLDVERPSADGRVSRRALGIGAAVGGLVGGIVGYSLYSGTDFSRNEAWPLFAGGATLIGAALGAGIGLGIVAIVNP